MNRVLKHIKGDKTIWAVVAFLALFSFIPVYSASTNLVYVVGYGSTLGYLKKHLILLLVGFAVIYGVHKIPIKFYLKISVLSLPVMILLLIYTLLQGQIIGGANASRWIRIPAFGIGFQTSVFAVLGLMIYVTGYFISKKEKYTRFKKSLLELWLPVGVILGLILLANFSTAAIAFFMIFLLALIGGYPLKYIGNILGISTLVFLFFVLTIKAFPDVIPNRVHTWENRVENFFKDDTKENYQVEKAKTAIATGGLAGKGVGKSVQKNFLPQSASDFIYAIIVEECGLVGAFLIVFFYFLLLFRILIVAKNAPTAYTTLLVIAVGLPIIFQAIVNMLVAVNLFPVTGQTLPLISSGGTSIIATCIALGIILKISTLKNKTEEISIEDNPLDVLHETIN